MNLSKQSWHAWVYQFFYGFDNPLPNNLCPYFWKFILSIALLAPCYIWQLPGILFQFVKSRFGKEKPDYWFKEGVFHLGDDNPMLISLGVNILFYFVTSMVGMWFDFSNQALLVGGIVGWGLAVAFFIFVLHEEGYFERKRKHKPPTYKEPKEAKPNILIEFIKAKYNKYCPKINWK